MFTILGAGGAIGNELVKQLAARSEAIPLVSRNAKLVPGRTEAIAADLSNLDDLGADGLRRGRRAEIAHAHILPRNKPARLSPASRTVTFRSSSISFRTRDCADQDYFEPAGGVP